MASTRQKVIGASSSIIIFVTLIGILSYIQDKNLNLTSYLQPITDIIQVQHNISKSELKQINTGISIQGAHDKLTRLTDLYTQNAKSNYKQPSPACYPHFQSLTSINEWTFTNTTKFNRLYFYHARKAGGTSLATYFSTVARHYGLEFAQSEWTEAEEPGSVPGTFYVAHLREPVDRSISHFKYQGRWDCSDLSKMRRRDDTAFIPSEETANKITTWNQTSGHIPQECTSKTSGTHFKLGICAVNCYIQWFSGLSCPQFNITTIQQYEVAKTMLLRYNFIVVLEKLKDAEYVKAVEKMFGVPGITQRGSAYCERTSHKANEMIPLKIEDDTLQRLRYLNRVDIGLYKELTDCLDDDRGDHKYNFPRMDEDGLENRFDTNTSIQVKYYNLIEWKKEERLNKTKAKAQENVLVEAAEAEITGESYGHQSDDSRPEDPSLNKKKLKRNKYKRANGTPQNKTKGTNDVSNVSVHDEDKTNACKTLWFSGFYDGRDHIDNYARFYSAALLSANQQLAKSSSNITLLQPVLLVGHLEENKNATPAHVQQAKDSFYQWVESQGGIVLHRDRLSFQATIDRYYSHVGVSHRQGPFFRLDIPNMIKKYNLLERNGVCRHNDAVLYTDCDVLFMNVTPSSLEMAKKLVSGSSPQIVAYGPQQDKRHKAWNTGVMFFSASRFGNLVNDILSFGEANSFKFISFDQGLLNSYFTANQHSRAILNLEWNYKAYWGVGNKGTIRIIHFHGPKPDGSTLDCLASMDSNSDICKSGNNGYPYVKLVEQGFQSDGGFLANRTLIQFQEFAKSYDWDKYI